MSQKIGFFFEVELSPRSAIRTEMGCFDPQIDSNLCFNNI